MPPLFTISHQGDQVLHLGLSSIDKPAANATHRFIALDTGQMFDSNGSSWSPVLKHVIVASLSDFPTPSSGVITLADDHAYLIKGTVSIGSNRIVCGTRNIIKGTDRSNDKITSTTTGALFTCDSSSVVKTIFTLENLSVSCSTGSLFNFTSTSANQSLVLISVTVLAFTSLGNIDYASTVVIRNSTVTGPVTSSGFTMTGTGNKTFTFRDSSVVNCAGTHFAFGTSAWTQIIFTGNILIVGSSQTCINGTTGGANVTAAGYINDNIFTGAGTYIATITADDSPWLWRNNTGVADGSVSHTHAWSDITGEPTTLAGYGITDAANISHSHAASDITSGQFAMTRLASGTPNGTKFIRDDGVLATPSGSSANVGTATIDFGAFPGTSDTSVAVTGQTSIASGSVVNAWIRLTATADHSADEHMVESISVRAGNIVAGTGFTIYGVNSSELTGNKIGDNGTRIYGQWSVQWQWV